MKKPIILILTLFLITCANLIAAPENITTTNIVSDKKVDVAVTVIDSADTAAGSVKTNIYDKFSGHISDVSLYLPAWLHSEVLNVKIWQIITAFIFILFGLILRKVKNYFFIHRKGFFIGKTSLSKMMIDAVGKPLGLFWTFLGVAAAVLILPLPIQPNIRVIILHILTLSFTSIFVWFLFKVIDVLSVYLKIYTDRTETKVDDQLLPLFRKTAKTLICIITFLWVIQLMGYKVSALLAGLGIGGLAVALALKDTLANLFGSIVILFDKPFRVGERIVVEGVDGVVEEIGLRSTRIRTLSKTLASIPNSIVANTKIDNVAKMPKRKVTQTIGVTYNTTADQMEQALAELRKIITDNKEVDKDFIVVRFNDFGDSSLNIKIINFTITIDYDLHLAVKEKINLAIMRKIEEMGLEFAFPSRTLYIKQ